MSYITDLPTIKNEFWKYTNLQRFFKEVKPEATERQASATLEQIDDLNLLTLKDLSLSIDLESKDFHIYSSSPDEIKSFKQREGYFTKEFASNVLQTGLVHYLTIEQTREGSLLRIDQEFLNDYKYQVVFIFKNIQDLKVFHKITGNMKGDIFQHQWVDLPQGKNFEQVLWQELGSEANFHLEGHAQVKKDALFAQVVVTKGASLSRHNTAVVLQEEHAECDVHGLYLPKGKSHHDTYSYTEHAAPHTYSRQLYKGILDDQSKGIFAGKVKVNKDCLLIDAQQLNKNLLLTSKAQAFSRPQMEIDADDVKCAHGSTTGQLSEQELFYFESRGIRKEMARKMMAEGFANDVLLKIRNPQLRQLAQQEGL